MNPRERKDYLQALQCLRSLPAKTSTKLVPGVRNRWDDFVAAHLLNTPGIHYNAWLFPWHRHFVWTMEQTLRKECNYTGSQPYWDWSKRIDLPFSENPLFDGTDTSFGGDGPKPSSNDTLNCITTGPFKNWTANLGPTPLGRFQILPQPQPNPRSDGLGYNPRCIERAFNTTELSTFMQYQHIANAITRSRSASDFLLAVEYNNGSAGAHGHPHRFTGGTMRDVAVSPSDPIFYMHHAMLDRMWAIWQGQDLETRTADVGNAKEILDPWRAKLLGCEYGLRLWWLTYLFCVGSANNVLQGARQMSELCTVFCICQNCGRT